MNFDELYNHVCALTSLDAIDNIIMAAKFAKESVFRKNIEDAIAAAQAAGLKVTFETYGVGMTVTEKVVLPTDELSWGVWLEE